jgi:hypothetical protein
MSEFRLGIDAKSRASRGCQAAAAGRARAISRGIAPADRCRVHAQDTAAAAIRRAGQINFAAVVGSAVAVGEFARAGAHEHAHACAATNGIRHDSAERGAVVTASAAVRDAVREIHACRAASCRIGRASRFRSDNVGAHVGGRRHIGRGVEARMVQRDVAGEYAARASRQGDEHERCDGEGAIGCKRGRAKRGAHVASIDAGRRCLV